MTALYITAGILLLLAALLLVRVQVGVSYIGDLRVELRLGPLRLDLTPEPAEPAAPEAEAPSGAAHKKKKKKKKEKEKGKGKAFSAREALPIALDTVGKLLRRTRRWLYCGRFVLKVNVACEDPAQTAALYGLISGQAAALTGGYASSYAQTASQQAYDRYMRDLAELMEQVGKSLPEAALRQRDAPEQSGMTMK